MSEQVAEAGTVNVDPEREAARQHALQVAETVGPILHEGLDIPLGHAYRFDVRQETQWLLRGPGDSISAFVDRQPIVHEDETQFHIEIRVFLDRPRATLFAQFGPRYFGQHVDLLGRDRFVYDERYDRLAETIVERINAAL